MSLERRSMAHSSNRSNVKLFIRAILDFEEMRVHETVLLEYTVLKKTQPPFASKLVSANPWISIFLMLLFHIYCMLCSF